LPDKASTLTRRLNSTAAWLAVNLALGYCATFPLTTAVVLWSYVRARVWGSEAAPFDGLEAEVASVFVIVGTLCVAGAFVVANRRARRMFSSPSATAFWVSAGVIQLAPFALFMTCTDRTFPALLGRGLLW
jgi:hypothetical protein